MCVCVSACLQVQSNNHMLSAYRQTHDFDISSLRPSQVCLLWPVFCSAYTRGLKLAAHGPHVAREGVICGPRHIIWNSKNLG